MNNALAKQDSNTFSLVPRSFEQALEFARLMASSDMVPKDYRGKPANVLVAVQMGQDLNLSPMQAIQNIAVINGRPALWGDAMLAVVQSHRDCRGIIESFDDATMTASCLVHRRGRPEVKRHFSRADAEAAGLWRKPGPWSQYPQRMLQMRARSFALRDSFADALRGIGSAEELIDVVDAKTGQKTERPPVYIEATVLESNAQPATEYVAPVDGGNDDQSDQPSAEANGGNIAPDGPGVTSLLDAVVDAFWQVNVQRTEIEGCLGHSLVNATTDELNKLRDIYATMKRTGRSFASVFAEHGGD